MMCSRTSGDLEIPGLVFQTIPEMTSQNYFFKYVAKNSRLRGQAMSALVLS
jgi:hypothetical protein